MSAVTPDVEAIVGAYLRADPTVAALVGDRIGGRTPRTLDSPWVRITQIGDTSSGARDTPFVHLVMVHLQLDCYGSSNEATSQAEASLLGRTIRAVLDDLPGPRAGAVVTAVTFGSLGRLPDGTLDPARERFILAADVYAHP